MGMGDGAITKILLQDAKLDVTGIDNEPKMIEQARKALRASIEQPVGDQDPAVAARNSAAKFSSSLDAASDTAQYVTPASLHESAR